MKFLNLSNTIDPQKRRFHGNLFKKEDTQQFDDDEFESTQEENDDDVESTIDEKQDTFKVDHLTMPLTDTIAEFVLDLSQEAFFINDLSFIFEMSRKRAVSPYAIVVALLYLRRMKQQTANNSSNFISSPISFLSSPYSTSSSSQNNFTNAELCLVSILLASKYLVDEGETEEIYNDDWAEASDFTVTRINQLERNMLKEMNWELYVSSDEFWMFTRELTEKTTRKKVKFQNGSCTYTDLDYLLRNSTEFSLDTFFHKHLMLLSQVVFVCACTVAYAVVTSYFSILAVSLVSNMSFKSTVPSTSSANLSNHFSLPTFRSSQSGKTISKASFPFDLEEFEDCAACVTENEPKEVKAAVVLTEDNNKSNESSSPTFLYELYGQQRERIGLRHFLHPQHQLLCVS